MGNEAALSPASTGAEAPLRLTAADDASLAIWGANRPLPIFCNLDDRDVAIVDAKVYRALVKAAGEASLGTLRLKDVLPRRKPRPVSTIERDGEVASFLRERFRSRATLPQLHSACLDRFGAERTPSAGRIGVFRSRAHR